MHACHFPQTYYISIFHSKSHKINISSQGQIRKKKEKKIVDEAQVRSRLCKGRHRHHRNPHVRLSPGLTRDYLPFVFLPSPQPPPLGPLGCRPLPRLKLSLASGFLCTSFSHLWLLGASKYLDFSASVPLKELYSFSFSPSSFCTASRYLYRLSVLSKCSCYLYFMWALLLSFPVSFQNLHSRYSFFLSLK